MRWSSKYAPNPIAAITVVATGVLQMRSWLCIIRWWWTHHLHQWRNVVPWPRQWDRTWTSNQQGISFRRHRWVIGENVTWIASSFIGSAYVHRYMLFLYLNCLTNQQGPFLKGGGVVWTLRERCGFCNSASNLWLTDECDVSDGTSCSPKFFAKSFFWDFRGDIGGFKIFTFPKNHGKIAGHWRS